MKQLARLASAGVLAAAVAGSTLGAVAAPQTSTNNGSSTFERTQRSSEMPALSRAATAGVPVLRAAGADRIETSVMASNYLWDDAGTPDGALAQAVVISRFDGYADALGGSALAGAAGGPLLLTHPTYIDASTMREVDRVLGRKGVVYVLGGTGAVSASAEKSLRDRGYTVKRLGGADRFATSLLVAAQVARDHTPDGQPQFVFATTGMNFPDGLAAGATAGGWSGVVVLTKDNVIPANVQSYLKTEKAAGVPIVAVGGAATQATFDWDHSYVGANRYETAALIARDFWANTSTPDDDPTAVALATGENWPDALSGGALVAGAGPLLLTQAGTFPATTKSATVGLAKSANPKTVQVGFVLGGKAIVSDTVLRAFTDALNS